MDLNSGKANGDAKLIPQAMSQEITHAGPTIPSEPVEPGLESPSLYVAAAGNVPAYELKFLLTAAQAVEIEERVRGHLVFDPHADLAAGFGYHTTSLYFDTPALDVFHRNPGFKRRKHRIRRYGDSPGVFLERKRKAADQVKKRRTLISTDEVFRLAEEATEESWPGHWFHGQLHKRQLAPVCRIAYERVALVGRSSEGPLRLTMDRNIRGSLTGDWDVAPMRAGLPILAGEIVCEFKYLGFLPMLFKEIIQAMQLTPRPVSKYRTFLRAVKVGDGSTANA
jgi:hypothetical protein